MNVAARKVEVLLEWPSLTASFRKGYSSNTCRATASLLRRALRVELAIFKRYATSLSSFSIIAASLYNAGELKPHETPPPNSMLE